MLKLISSLINIQHDIFHADPSNRQWRAKRMATKLNTSKKAWLSARIALLVLRTLPQSRLPAPPKSPESSEIDHAPDGWHGHVMTLPHEMPEQSLLELLATSSLMCYV